MSETKVHPIAALFPMLDVNELTELANSIETQGLLHAIVVDKEGRILDGRNRHAACKLARIEPRFETYSGDDPDGYALSVNINRRHMKPGARHLVTEMARRLANANGVGKSLHSQREAAKEAEISVKEISNAAAVLDHSIDGDLVQRVLRGEMGLQAAADLARTRKQGKIDRDLKIQRLKTCAPDLYARVEDTDADIDEMIGALEAREKKDAAAERNKEIARIEILKDAEEAARDIFRDFTTHVGSLIDGVKMGQNLITPAMIANIERELESLKDWNAR